MGDCLANLRAQILWLLIIPLFQAAGAGTLIAYPAKAQEYSRLKADLIAGGNSPPEVYINGKSPFIKETESQAISWLRSTQ